MTGKNGKIPVLCMAEREALLATSGEKVAMLSSSGGWLACLRLMVSLRSSRRRVGR